MKLLSIFGQSQAGFKNSRFLLLLVCFILLLGWSVNLYSVDKARQVHIKYVKYITPNDYLEIKVIQGEKEVKGIVEPPDSYIFELRKNDLISVTLELEVNEQKGSQGETKDLKIEYEISGYDVDKHYKSEISKIFTGAQTTESTSRTEDGKEVRIKEKLSKTIGVGEDLIPGGRLTVTFKKIIKGDNNQDSEVDIRPPLIFRVKDEDPWFFTSFGIAFSTGRSPEVKIVSTNEMVNFERDGEIQQVKKQIIILSDNEKRPRPIQTVITYLNFRFSKKLYSSLGFPLNEEVFKEPMVGLSYYWKRGNYGWVVTGGIHFKEELEILKDSGFREGQLIDPNIGLTADEIPTENKYHIHPFIGFSFRF